MTKQRLYKACKAYRDFEVNVMVPGYAANLARIWTRARDDEWYRNWVLEATGHKPRKKG